MRKFRRPAKKAWPAWLHVQEPEGTWENVLVDVVVSSQAVHNRILGAEEKRLKVGVATPVAQLQANTLLVRLMASRLDLQTAQISVTAGHTSRFKRVSLIGVSPERIVSLLMAQF